MRMILTILSVYYSAVFGQSVYHVSNSGSDANSGTSALPFLTINHALSVAVTGDSILLNKGNTFNAVLVISTANLKFNAYGSGANPVISGYETITGFTNVGSIWSATAMKTTRAISGKIASIWNSSCKPSWSRKSYHDTAE